MIREGDLDYACARIGARYGARPDDSAWRRIETVRDLPAMLDAARATTLRPWTAGLSAEEDVHATERALRGHWRALAAELAAWMPARWKASLAWCALVPQLAAIDHVRRGQVLSFDDALDARLTERRDALAPLFEASDARSLVEAWRAEWRRRLPRSHAREAPLLAPLAKAVGAHFDAMRAAPPGDATPIVRSLGRRLEALYRRASLEPTAAFAYLALAAIDLARLRGEIVRRALFPRLAP
jgi:hypothetical protein